VRIFGPKMEKVTGGWKRNCYEELNLFSSPKILMVIKSRGW